MLKFTTTGTKCRGCHDAETSKAVSSCCKAQAGLVLMQDGMSFDHWECQQCKKPCELVRLNNQADT